MVSEKTIGETLKEIRCNMGWTQEDLAKKSNISRSAVAKIEANKMNPSVDLLNSIIFNLHMNYREFIFIKNNYTLNDRDKLIHDFKRLGNSVYKDAILQLDADMSTYLSNHDDSQILELHAVLKALNQFQNHQNFNDPTNEIQFIWSRLQNQDNWNEFDIYLLSHIFFKFDPGDVDTMISSLLKNIDKYSDFNTYNTLKISLLLNIITYFKHHGMLLEAEQYIDEAYELATAEKDFRRKLAVMYRQCEVLYIKGQKNMAIEKANKIFQTLELLGEEDLYKDWLDEWGKLIKK
ncbi:helix-turn-helix domain-containing protein [Listeria booriae]|uniref:Helix-turn-helix domain-containing protein n=1 Tax=Listeria booriae TaxID=1552123 RepID=A0A842G8Z4_9LIST|nr:Rgg/GadR/MutR family transcriptional regulator [Listeria booriae]MBC2292920.1 helix-turn-helix domain-containing protein [Listeria booriae]